MTQVILTQRVAKQTIADALTSAKRRNRWSNVDLGDIISRSEGTVRNRLDDDSPKDQMEVYELMRLCAAVSDDQRLQILCDIGLIKSGEAA